jgi:hypothetical protein
MKQLHRDSDSILIDTKLFIASNVRTVLHNFLQSLKESDQLLMFRAAKLQFIHVFSPRPRVPASPRRRSSSGQSIAEFVILLPLFVIMAAALGSVAYICFQGIKVQQAANYAARIQGQERVLGGSSGGSINADSQGVFNRYTRAAKSFFVGGEESKLTISEPSIGLNSDRITVTRTLSPPHILGMQLPPVVLEASAYGGEDTRMHSLPRWGDGFYKSALQRTAKTIND